MKKLLIISICIFSLLLTGCGCNKKENNDIIENQIVNEIQFSNANIEYKNNMSTFTAVVTNKSTIDKNVGIVNIVFKNKDNDEIITLKGLIEKNLNPNQSTTITASVGIDLSEATYIEYNFD